MKKELFKYIALFFLLPVVLCLIATLINVTAGKVTCILTLVWFMILAWLYIGYGKNDNQDNEEQEIYTPNSNAFKK